MCVDMAMVHKPCQPQLPYPIPQTPMVIGYGVSTNPVDNPLKYLCTLLLTCVYICIHCQQGFFGTQYAPTPCMGCFGGLGVVLYIVVCHPGGIPEVVVSWHKVAYHIRGCAIGELFT